MLNRKRRVKAVGFGSLFLSPLALVPMGGCENLPGDRGTQGAVIGGAGGATAGALLAEDNRLLGALIGGALGAGGGYLIGAEMDNIREENREEAIQAAREAERNPAQPGDVMAATTADLNNDGFVTMDEVIAMQRAGLSDDEILRRLRATGQIFELTQTQEQQLVQQGVSPRVVEQMRTINQAQREQLLQQQEVIGQQPAR